MIGEIVPYYFDETEYFGTNEYSRVTYEWFSDREIVADNTLYESCRFTNIRFVQAPGMKTAFRECVLDNCTGLSFTP